MAAKLDLALCPQCQHPKHFGRVCGEVLDPVLPAGEENCCQCSDANTRKADRGKQGGWHLLPWEILGYVAEIYNYGRRKYAANSWQSVPADPETGASPQERYEDAMFRHWSAFKRGEWLDPESGKPHLAHFCWGALTVFWFALRAQRKDST